MNKNLNRIYPLYFTYPAFFLYAAFFLLPTVASFFMAFTDWNAMKKEICFIGFENFKFLFTDAYFKIALKKHTDLWHFYNNFESCSRAPSRTCTQSHVQIIRLFENCFFYAICFELCNCGYHFSRTFPLQRSSQ